ncbi:MAG: glycosyltransferase [Ilumatobacter sp.]|nr:glycosyltransferase [Ilumatobacter sp.]
MNRPRFSVLTTVYDPDPDHLRACLASVDAQTDGDWEHVVVDDASSDAAVVTALRDAAAEPRRTVIRRPVNGGIVAASNVALAAAGGEYVVLLDHDDVLAANALEALREAIDRTGRDVLYSDHDVLRADGRRGVPIYKPAYSPERLRSHNYITHLVAARRAAVNSIGGFRPGFDGAQDHDLLLRLAERFGPFEHVPQILLHWRQAPASVASDIANKPDATEHGRRAVGEHLQRVGVDAIVDHGQYPGIYRIRRALRGRPTVSVVVPTRGSRGRAWGVERIHVHHAIASLLAADGGCELEVVAVIDRGTDPVVERGLRRVAGDALVVVEYDAPFNFADKVNTGVAASSGEYVLILNDDTELIAPDSVAELVGLAQQDDVGMVGAKLLYDDGRLQHAGHVYNHIATHAMIGWWGGHPGPHRLLAVERECAGVTAAAALVPRAVHDDVGGMNTDFAVNYNDVDYSLKIRMSGRRILWTPHACWYHFEHGSDPNPVLASEIAALDAAWGDWLHRDPYYNPNLAEHRCDWLERPLQSGWPTYEILDDGEVAWA